MADRTAERSERRRVHRRGTAADRRRRHDRRRGALDAGDDRDDGAHRRGARLEHLPEGQATVGFEVCIKHVARRAPRARTCTAHGDAERGRRRAQAALRRRGHARASGRSASARTSGAYRGPARGAPSMAEFPDAVRIREVGPRDGFQNEPEVIATDDKVRLIDMLAATGLTRLEVDVLRARRRDPAARRRRRGARRARAPRRRRALGPDPERARARQRARAARPLRRDQRLPLRLGDPQPQERQPLDRGVARRASSACIAARPRGRACAARASSRRRFGCPYEGEVPARARVRDRRAARATPAAQEIGFGDTTGMANPRQVARVLRRRARAARPTSS